MGRDEEVPAHFGMLHGKTLTPHRPIWTLGDHLGRHRHRHGRRCTSAARRPRRSTRSTTTSGTRFGIFDPATIAKLPNTLVIVTLVSNFGTFLLYMITNASSRSWPSRSTTRSTASSTCWSLCSAGGESALHALLSHRSVHGVRDERQGTLHRARHVRVWGIYGAVYFLGSSKRKQKSVLLDKSAVEGAQALTT